MKSWRYKWLVAIWVVLLPFATVAAQIGQTGHIVITGSVPAVYDLDISPSSLGDTVRPTVQKLSRSTLLVRVAGTQNSSQADVTLPLVLRSNAAFSLKIGNLPQNAQACTSLENVSGLGDAGLVAENAITSLHVQSPCASSGSEPVVSGGRISKRGNASSVNNAILVRLHVRLDHVGTEQSFVVSMGPA